MNYIRYGFIWVCCYRLFTKKKNRSSTLKPSLKSNLRKLVDVLLYIKLEWTQVLLNYWDQCGNSSDQGIARIWLLSSISVTNQVWGLFIKNLTKLMYLEMRWLENKGWRSSIYWPVWVLVWWKKVSLNAMTNNEYFC